MAGQMTLANWLARENQPMDGWSPLKGTKTQVALLEAAIKAMVKAIPTRMVTKDMPRVAAYGTFQELITGVPAKFAAAPRTTELLRAMEGRTLIDLFAGVGGVTLAGLRCGLKVEGYNHFPHAVAINALNFSGRHFVADLGEMEEILLGKRYACPGPVPMGEADLAWNSAPCPPHSQARIEGQQSLNVQATAAARKEALMKARVAAHSVLDFARNNRLPFFFTENVIPFAKWTDHSRWLQEWQDRGYVTIQLSLNARFFGVAQNRDRLIYVHVRRDMIRKIDLSFTVPAWCSPCRREVSSVQRFKRNSRTQTVNTYGVYGRQYVMACPRCDDEVHPPARPMADHIDFSDIGTSVAERGVSFDPSRARIQAGIDRLQALGLPPQPIMIRQDYNQDPAHKRPGIPVSDLAPTIGCRQVFGFAFHPSLAAPGLDGQGHLKRWPRAEECTFRMAKPMELAMMQGFPPDIHLGEAALGNKRYATVMVGNAVPPQVAEGVMARACMALAS